MDYTSKYLTIQDITDRIAELVAQGYEVEPKDEDNDEAWELYNECHILQEVEHELNWCWDQGNTTLIHTNNFDEYARDCFVDMGEIKKESVLMNLIDWDIAANMILQDYKRVNLPEDNDYWVKA